MTTNRGSYLLGAVLGSALVLTLAPRAMAADIYEAPLKGGYEVPPPPPSDRGIYFKGYIGQANPEGSIWVPGFATTNVTVVHEDIKSSPLFGLGIGYKRNHWLRFDLTGEYRGDAIFVGQDIAPNTGNPPSNLQTNEYTADIHSWLGLANAYWDIVNWCGFTPYVGAGIGFATVSVKGLKDVNVPLQGVAFGADHTKTNFAWAVHAGVSYDVSPQFAVDLAYRYAQLGSASSGPVQPYDGSQGYSAFSVKDINSNDLMLGFRYKFQRDEPVYAIK